MTERKKIKKSIKKLYYQFLVPKKKKLGVDYNKSQSLNSSFSYKIEDKCVTFFFHCIKIFTRQILEIKFSRITCNIVIRLLRTIIIINKGNKDNTIKNRSLETQLIQ